jgi:serine/threonine-protein kinase
LPDGDCFVAAGPFWSGGDPGAGDGLPARRVWLEAFVIRRHPLTNAEYLAFLRDLPTDEAERWAPRGGPNPFGRVDGVYSLGDAAADAPVVCIPWHAAAAYCRWAARDGHAWRLPHSFEWEKAARGVDGRRFPWGDHFEPTWANTVDSRADPPAVTSVHAFPLDASLYGVRGLTGNSRDLCRDDYSRFGPTLAGDRLVPEEGNMEAWKVAKGGAYSNGGSLVRPATRFGASPAAVFRMVGFRLARDAFR